jgi:hypothetical protein
MRRTRLSFERLFGAVWLGVVRVDAIDGSAHIDADVFERGGTHYRASAELIGGDVRAAHAHAAREAWRLCARRRPDLVDLLSESPELRAQLRSEAREWN